jgi:hypothetical protein
LQNIRDISWSWLTSDIISNRLHNVIGKFSIQIHHRLPGRSDSILKRESDRFPDYSFSYDTNDLIYCYFPQNLTVPSSISLAMESLLSVCQRNTQAIAFFKLSDRHNDIDSFKVLVTEMEC